MKVLYNYHYCICGQRTKATEGNFGKASGGGSISQETGCYFILACSLARRIALFLLAFSSTRHVGEEAFVFAFAVQVNWKISRQYRGQRCCLYHRVLPRPAASQTTSGLPLSLDPLLCFYILFRRCLNVQYSFKRTVPAGAVSFPKGTAPKGRLLFFVIKNTACVINSLHKRKPKYKMGGKK